MRYLDPNHDLVFRKVFGHANLLQSFLNALLPLSSPIESLAFGLQKGKQAMALAMLAKGLPLSDIAEITGLPLSAVERLTIGEKS